MKKLEGLEPEQIIGYVKRREKELYSHKEAHIKNSQIAWNEYNDYSCGNKSYNVNIFYAIVMSFLASIYKATPEYGWIGLDEKGKKNAKIVNYTWMYWLMRDGSLQTLLRVFHDGIISGAGYLYEGFFDNYSERKYTHWNNGKSTIKKGKKGTYYGPKSSYIPFENVLGNGRTFNDSTEVIIIRTISEGEFEQQYGNNKNYHFNIDSVMGRGAEDNSATEDQKISYNNVKIIEYFNTVYNYYIVIANDQWINDVDGEIMPNPYPHMQVPISAFIPFPNPQHQYGDSIAQRTQLQRELYNKAMELFIAGQENMQGMIGGDAVNNDIKLVRDEKTKLMILEGIDREEIWQFTPQINLSYILQFIQIIKNDIVMVSGIDFQTIIQTNPYETSTANNNRSQTFLSRISLSLAQNSFDFFDRWARQRIMNIQSMYDFSRGMSIVVKGKNISRDEDGLLSESLDEGASSVEILPEDLEGLYDLHLDVDTLSGPSRQQQLEEALAIVQLIGNLRDPKTGGSYLSPEQIISIMDNIYKFHNLESITSKSKPIDIENPFENNDLGQPTEPITQNIPTIGSLSAQ